MGAVYKAEDLKRGRATPTARKAKQRGDGQAGLPFLVTVNLAAWHALVTNGDLR